MINHVIGLGPAMKLDNTQVKLFRDLANDVDRIYYWLDFFKIDEVFGPSWSILSSGFCIFNRSFC